MVTSVHNIALAVNAALVTPTDISAETKKRRFKVWGTRKEFREEVIAGASHILGLEPQKAITLQLLSEDVAFIALVEDPIEKSDESKSWNDIDMGGASLEDVEKAFQRSFRVAVKQNTDDPAVRYFFDDLRSLAKTIRETDQPDQGLAYSYFTFLEDELPQFSESATADASKLSSDQNSETTIKTDTVSDTLTKLAGTPTLYPGTRSYSMKVIIDLVPANKAVEVLTELANHHDNTTQYLSAEALVQLDQTETATKTFARLAQDQTLTHFEQLQVATTLAELGETDTAINMLAKLIQDPQLDPVYRSQAPSALVKIGEPATNQLTKLIQNTSLHPRIQLILASGLGELSQTEIAIETLTKLVLDTEVHSGTQVAAAHYLGEMGQTDLAINTLAKLAQDQNIYPGDQRNAADILGLLGEPAIETLTELSENSDLHPNIHFRAQRSLSIIRQRTLVLETARQNSISIHKLDQKNVYTRAISRIKQFLNIGSRTN